MSDSVATAPSATSTAVGMEIGAVSVKWVSIGSDGEARQQVIAHGGAPRQVVERLFADHEHALPARVVVTGHAAKALFDFPYRSATECLEAALSTAGLEPDIVLSLGGETFSVYPLRGGTIKNVLSTSKCAAGTGEFIVQQFQRMGMDLAQGIEQARQGKRVPLATRCSVHCKSDATHMLNKGECSRGDIAASLIADLAERAAELVAAAQWSTDSIVIAGGVAQNDLFVQRFAEQHPQSTVTRLPASTCLEAYGAARLASELPATSTLSSWRNHLAKEAVHFQRLEPLSAAEPLLDYRVAQSDSAPAIRSGAELLLGVDAGSTTTKAVLLDREDGSVKASSYLRTLGNPIRATQQCLAELADQVGSAAVEIVQLATTGSGREMVSVFLGNCLSANEIVAHARAAAHYLPAVSTVFEIGGQDSKFISFLDGIPVDYAMNEGCSAGTGSFLEESASLDLGVPMKDISATAERSERPIAFGERCAAFINTDLRNALQQGAGQQDVIAGLVYSIADNYISRIVGPRQLGEHLLLLGGVALNRSVALAIAARTGRKVVVPPHPELMGCIGAALEARDALSDGAIAEQPRQLGELGSGEMEVRGSFRCKACENNCELKKIAVSGKLFPFGGLCSKYELQRRGRGDAIEGRDLVALRNRMMFEEYGPQPVAEPRGTIGIPMALTAFELFPLYAKLVTALGYDVVLSQKGSRESIRTAAAICYPCQLVHGAVDDLIERGVDYVLLPRIVELTIPEGGLHSYTCPSTTVIPDIVRSAIEQAGTQLLCPHIGLSHDLTATSLLEIERLAPILGLQAAELRRAGERALEHYESFRQAYRERSQTELEQIAGEPTVVLAGRPYSVYSPDVNLALPRKVASRGFHAVPADMLPSAKQTSHQRDVWHFTQQIGHAIDFVEHHDNAHLCLVSCFSCGPDSVMVHEFRQRLAGSTFCYLEIDSHTAHAGFETRVGAFLDIVEQRDRRRRETLTTAASTEGAALARLAPERDAFVDSDGARVEYDDPRVVHVLTDLANPLTGRLAETVYEKAGRRCRSIERPRAETMQLAKQICSGRECIPLIATAGAAVKDMMSARTADELTVYLTLDQEGPCQNAAWPLVWEAFMRRLDARNVIGGVGRSAANHQLGLSGAHSGEINRYVLLGDILLEAQYTLASLAVDRRQGLERFESAFQRLLAGLRAGEAKLEPLLERFSLEIADVPLRLPVDRAPKVLIFGGLNVSFVHDPVSECLIEHGVVPKVIELAEGLCSVASEGVVRSAFKHGHVDSATQLSFAPPRTDRKELTTARMSRYGVRLIESQIESLRAALAPSGLLFDEPLPFADVMSAGGAHVSNSGFTETGITVGRYVTAVQQGLYDGLVNLGCFNCQPAMNSQAIIRPLAGDATVPYVAIDCEGPWISTSQAKLLETVAVQARRIREQKSASAS